MASYNPIGVGGGVIAVGGGTVLATVLPQTGVTATVQIAISAAVALLIWAGVYTYQQRKTR